MRGADLLAAAMADAGVRTVFSLSGNQIMPLYDAFIETDIRVVHTRHEAASVFMADAYAQISGSVGIALVTAGPGFGNALGALYTARMSESPVIFLSGDSPVSLDGAGAFQEFPQVEAARPFVKHSERVSRPGALREAFVEAVRVAGAGRPGPVHLALPFDVLNGDGGDGRRLSRADFESPRQVPDDSTTGSIVETLRDAHRPLVLVGPGLGRSRAGRLVGELSATLKCPVVTVQSPRGLRDPALGAITEVLGETDTVLYLGKPPDFAINFGRPLAGAIALAVDSERDGLDSAAAAHGERLQLSVQTDPQACADALIARADTMPERAAWRSTVNDAVALRARPEAGGKITPYAVATGVNKALLAAPKSILVCDGGEFGQWAQAFASAPTRIINGPSGAIGASLPYAIASKIASPEATVIAMMGDGTAGFHLAEFETAAREGTDIVVVIGNDARWNAEHLIQVRDFGPDRTLGCELSRDARYDLAAAALGCYGRQVDDPSDVDTALSEAIQSGRPACLNVTIEGLPAPVVSRTTGAPPDLH